VLQSQSVESVMSFFQPTLEAERMSLLLSELKVAQNVPARYSRPEARYIQSFLPETDKADDSQLFSHLPLSCVSNVRGNPRFVSSPWSAIEPEAVIAVDWTYHTPHAMQSGSILSGSDVINTNDGPPLVDVGTCEVHTPCDTQTLTPGYLNGMDDWRTIALGDASHSTHPN
jgi:hypothetical protein